MNPFPSFFVNLKTSMRERALVSGISLSGFYLGTYFLHSDYLLNIVKINNNFNNLGLFAQPMYILPPIAAAGGVMLPKLLSISTTLLQEKQQDGTTGEAAAGGSPKKRYTSGKSFFSIKGKNQTSSTTSITNELIIGSAPPGAILESMVGGGGAAGSSTYSPNSTRIVGSGSNALGEHRKKPDEVRIAETTATAAPATGSNHGNNNSARLAIDNVVSAQGQQPQANTGKSSGTSVPSSDLGTSSTVTSDNQQGLINGNNNMDFNNDKKEDEGLRVPEKNIDSVQIAEVLDQKVKPIIEEVSVAKQDIVTVKNDISSINASVQELKSTLETSLIDIKAFQAEMVNPINFMRKYFDSLDVKTLSDPTAPLSSSIEKINQHRDEGNYGSSTNQVEGKNAKSLLDQKHEEFVLTVEALKSAARQGRDDIINNNNNNSGTNPNTNGYDNNNNSESINFYDKVDGLAVGSSGDDTLSSKNEQNFSSLEDMNGVMEAEARYHQQHQQSSSSYVRQPHPSDNVLRNKNLSSRGGISREDSQAIRSMLNTGMTPGKIMSIVSLIDEVLASMGPEGIDLLVEQYKRVGLTPQDELVIYTVLRLINDSKIYTDDIIAMMYRFGQVLGLNDKDAELQYARLIANKNRRMIPGQISPKKGVEE